MGKKLLIVKVTSLNFVIYLSTCWTGHLTCQLFKSALSTLKANLLGKYPLKESNVTLILFS